MDQQLAGKHMQLETFAKELKHSSSQLALAWLQHLPGPVVPVVGSLNRKHLEDAFAASRVRLPRDLWYQLMVIGRGRPIPHNPAPVLLYPNS
jgi:predicted oxidoreductase